MSHTRAELFAEPIATPGPKLAGRMYYVDLQDEDRERRAEALRIHEKWERRLDALHAGGWRRLRRILRDKEYRNRPVAITIPVWLAVFLSLSGYQYPRGR